MNHFGPPLAAGDWIGGAIFLAFVIFSILAQLVGKWQEAHKEAARRARRNPPQRPPQAGGQLEDEIAEFLRRRVQGQKPVASERPSPPSPLPASPPAREPQRPLRPPPAPRPVRVEPVEAEIVVVPAEREDFLGEAAWARPRPSPFNPPPPAARAADAAQSDGTLSGPMAVASGADAPPAVNAATLAALLANPANLRQAVLLSEILRRPEERYR